MMSPTHNKKERKERELRIVGWLKSVQENRIFLVWLAVAAAAFAIKHLVPAALWLVVPLTVLFFTFQIFYETAPTVRKRLALACLMSLVVTVAASEFAGLHNPETCPLSLDDATYLAQAKAIADAWESGFFPVLSAKGSAAYYIGSLHTGYQRLLAGLFFLFGSDFRLGIFVNYVAALLLPVFLFSGIRTLIKTHMSSVAAEKAAIRGAWLLALYPSTGYWASWLLKDVVLAMLFAASLAAILDFAQRLRPEHLLYFGTCCFAVGIFRAYAALAILAGIVSYLLAKLPRQVSVYGLLIFGFALMMLSYTDFGSAYFRQLVYSLGELLPDSIRTPKQGMIYVLTGLPRLLLSPYAWVRARVENPMYELYPGMWWLCLVVYPLAILGLIRLAQWNVQLAAIPFVAWFCSAMILILAYGGAAPRQRLYLDIIMFVFAGCGAAERPPSRIPVFVWYAVLAIYAIIHLLTLDLRGV